VVLRWGCLKMVWRASLSLFAGEMNVLMVWCGWWCFLLTSWNPARRPSRLWANLAKSRCAAGLS
jgi:hypothetical protein